MQDNQCIPIALAGDSFAHLPPLSPPELFFVDEQPSFQGALAFGICDDKPSTSGTNVVVEDAKLKALRARNSAAQKRYQVKQKAKLIDLEARQQQLTQRLHDLQQEQAQLNKHATLLNSRLRGQEDQLHELLCGLDIWDHGPALPEFNGDYQRPQMCGIDIPLVVPPELIDKHKHTKYEDIVEHYSRIVANMHDHLAEADTARDTTTKEAALAAVASDVQEMCVIFMAAAVHNPLHVKKMIASVGMAVPWRAIDQGPPDLVVAMQQCVATLQLTKREVEHIMALRTRCLRMLGAAIVTRRQIVHDIAFAAAHGASKPTARPLRGGLHLGSTNCSRGRALSIMKLHELLAKLHASMLESHIHVMQFVEDLYNKYLLPQPVVVARCCVKTFPYFPDDLSFATAVGVFHGRLDATGHSLQGGLLPGGVPEGSPALLHSGPASTEEGGAVLHSWSSSTKSGACMWQGSKGGEACVSMTATAVEIS